MTRTSRRSRSPRGSGELLADEIIDAATSLLLDSEAASAVSIRAVADRVGVTPPSIYLHFDDKDALLEAVCARYFERLDEVALDVVGSGEDPDPHGPPLAQVTGERPGIDVGDQQLGLAVETRAFGHEVAELEQPPAGVHVARA